MEFVVAIGTLVTNKIIECTFVPIGRQLSYVFQSTNNVNKLRIQVQEFKTSKDRLQHRVDDARRNGEEVEADVRNWLSKADHMVSEELDTFLSNEDSARTRCSSGPFLNIVSRYQFGRKAMKLSQKVVREVQEASKFDSISYRPALESSSTISKGYEAFETRMPILKGIMEELRDPTVSMIGVYGMSGIGKTMLVKEVAREAKEEKLFTEVVLTTISQTPNIKNIQQEVADNLGLEFHGVKSISGRANLLLHRLRREPKILIILDDVWGKLDLLEMGIHFEHDKKGCKILITSRSLDVLHNTMSVVKNFHIEVLPIHEGLTLFNKITGAIADNADFKALALEIIRECAGLPIAIATVAYALKNKSLSIWKDALLQLKSSNPINIEGMYEDVYPSISLSYNFLGSEEAKSLLLLCSLYEKDADILIENLMRYTMGWSLLQDVITLDNARNRVHSLVDRLRARSMLLDGNRYGTVKMHDIIRDVTMSIASRDKHMHSIANVTKLEEWLNEKKLMDSRAISLLVHDDSKQLPERLECPQLELLLMFCKSGSSAIPDYFFEETKKLKTLYLYNANLQPLPSSFHLLENLQTLRLYSCNLSDLASIGDLKNLRILDLAKSKIHQLPETIGQLTCLQLLDLEGCEHLKVIPHNVISNLVRLEELYMPGTFEEWGFEEVNTERGSASLSELRNLQQLNTACLSIPDAEILPKGLFCKKLEKYRISVGGQISYDTKHEISRWLDLKLRGGKKLYELGLELLMKRSEVLSLDGLAGISNVVYELDKEGFPLLKHLHFCNNAGVQYIVNSVDQVDPCPVFLSLESLDLCKLMSLEKIVHGKLTADSFNKLRMITVASCSRLKNLLPLSIVNQLHYIEVEECEIMEEIVARGREDEVVHHEVEFPKLCSLSLKYLPKFVQFCQSKLEQTFAFPSLDSPKPLFSEKVVKFPNLEKLNLFGINVQNLWPDHLPVTCNYMQNLTSLNVKRCNSLKYLFSFVVAERLVQLRQLEVSGCLVMEDIVGTGKLEAERIHNLEKISFPKLESLELSNLPVLERFYAGDCIEFPALVKLVIRNCKVKTFVPYPTPRRASMRQQNEVDWVARQPLFDEKVTCPSLAVLNLHDTNIMKLWDDKPLVASYIQNLTELTIWGCNNLKYLFCFTMARSLVHLLRLEILSCKAIEEVATVEKPGRKGMLKEILCPKLVSLELWHLPNVMRLCEGDCIEFPSLSILVINNCPKLSVFITKSMATLATVNPEQLQQTNLLTEQHLSKEMVMFPNLNDLETDTREVVHDVLRSPLLPALPFCNIKRLCLSYGCWEKPIALSIFALLRSYQNLETLELNGVFVDGLCDHHHEQLGTAHENIGKLTMHLRWLRIEEVPLLMHLFGNPENTESVGDYSLQLTLETLKVKKCSRLKNFVPSSMSFNNLTTVVVSECHGLTYLFAASTAKSLVQLKELSIIDCKKMKEIIGYSKNDEISGGDDGEFLLRRLEILVLHNLPNLEIFHSGHNNVIRFPLLQKLFVSQCPGMIRFSFGIINTPVLSTIVTEIEEEWLWYVGNLRDAKPVRQLWYGDVNTTVGKLWENNSIMGFRQLFSEGTCEEDAD